MAMSTSKRAAITVLLAAAFGGALFFALRGQQQERIEQQNRRPRSPARSQLKGLIALDVEGYFKDERVIKRWPRRSLPVNVVRVGSRDMAGKVVAGQHAGLLLQLGRGGGQPDRRRRAQGQPAGHADGAVPHAAGHRLVGAHRKILVANGIAKAVSPKVYGVDMGKLTQLMLSASAGRT
jgi:hypothetical protein